jgi:hypothetical protein
MPVEISDAHSRYPVSWGKYPSFHADDAGACECPDHVSVRTARVIAAKAKEEKRRKNHAAQVQPFLASDRPWFPDIPLVRLAYRPGDCSCTYTYSPKLGGMTSPYVRKYIDRKCSSRHVC